MLTALHDDFTSSIVMLNVIVLSFTFITVMLSVLASYQDYILVEPVFCSQNVIMRNDTGQCDDFMSSR
jgi:hypothetical protein